MPFLSYTIFADRDLSVVRHFASLQGSKAVHFLNIFRTELGREPREGDVAIGCRIDRIGSEEQPNECL